MANTAFSDIPTQKYDRQKKHVTSNGKYFISTNDTFDRGWETMVFARNPHTGDIDYMDLDCQHYIDENEAYIGHDHIINKWEAKS